MRKFIAFPAIALLVGALCGCHDGHLDDLARQGMVDSAAPIQASLKIVVSAPPDVVWRILAGISQWPEWQTAITTADIAGPVAPGTEFTWKAGMTVHSRLALVEPDTRLAWTGSALMAHAIHIWTLQPVAGGKTLVKTRESMDGFLLTHFYSSKNLAEADQLWLESLKTRAELTGPPSGHP